MNSAADRLWHNRRKIETCLGVIRGIGRVNGFIAS